MKPRLVKSQREMEGRFEDVWVLVDEEDEVETWPDEAELQVVGSPAPRQDGAVRAGGAARYTVDVQLAGMLHALVLRAPFARCRVTGLDLDAARATPGVRAVIGPEGPLTHERRQPADRRAGVGRRTRRGDRGGHARGGDGGPRGARAHLRGAGAARPRGRPRRAAVHRGPARDRPRRPRRRARRRRRADRAHLRDPGARAVAARAARRRRPLGGRLAHRLGLDAGDLRRPPGARTALRPRAGAGARDLRVHRRRLRREAGRRDRGAPRRRARPRHRSAGAPRAAAATRSRSWAAGARGRGRR